MLAKKPSPVKTKPRINLRHGASPAPRPVPPEIIRQPPHQETATVRLQTHRGEAVARYHPAVPGEKRGGVIWVGGVGGGFGGPGGIYPDLCHYFQDRGIAGLRIDYRFPSELDSCILDTLIGIDFLLRRGVEPILLAGHSFGGAVVINAGVLSRAVGGVIAFATQSLGAELVPQLAPRPLLLVHGTKDLVLPPICSKHVFERAKAPKELKLIEGAGHNFDEARDKLVAFLQDWIPQRFK
jgi:pimeloyl-ACP methyl ester carboxylesterase